MRSTHTDVPVDDRFVLEEQIASGGMATVWRARDAALGRNVAVKFLHPHAAADPEAAARFQREGQAIAALSHPGVVTVHDLGVDHRGPYLVMEYVEGESLADVIRREGRLSPVRAAGIALEVAAALDHAHGHGIVHRDVKPGNVLIDRDGHVKLADFGIAHTADSTARLTQTGSVMGTVAYLSPEQAAGETATPASDIYALGVVLYEMLTGSVPFDAPTPIAVALAHRQRDPRPPGEIAEVPSRLEAIVMRALAKDPADRYGSVREMAHDLGAWISHPTDVGDSRPTAPTPLGDRNDTLMLSVPAATTDRPRRAWWVPAAVVGVAGMVLMAALTGSGGEAVPTRDSPGRPAETTTTAVSTTTTTEAPTSTTSSAAVVVSTFPEAIRSLRDTIDRGVASGTIAPKLGGELDKKSREALEHWEEGRQGAAGGKLNDLVDKLNDGLEKDDISRDAADAVYADLVIAADLLDPDR